MQGRLRSRHAQPAELGRLTSQMLSDGVTTPSLSVTILSPSPRAPSLASLPSFPIYYGLSSSQFVIDGCWAGDHISPAVT